MLILYLALKHDYGIVEQGLSFEHYNFYDTLVRMGHDILYFDLAGLVRRHGREGMNRRLFEVARAERPDLMFSVLFRDEIDPRVVRRISRETETTTLNWFCDDQWRFDDLSRRFTPSFDWVVTTCAGALPRYARAGLRNVLRSQWACNHFLYRRLDLPLRHDVTFVGQPHGRRGEVVSALRRAGLSVQVWGQGWESGRLPQERMIEIFNQSRVNLNLANASSAPPGRVRRLVNGARRAAAGVIGRAPGGARLKSLGRRLLAAVPRPGAASTAEGAGEPTPGQIKGRNFEVPGCGGFLLSDPAEDLESYYASQREIALFSTPDDLARQAAYYLKHEEERAAIARAGYERTVREHTYVHRFCDIFRAIGLDDRAASEFLQRQAGVGHTVEIG